MRATVSANADTSSCQLASQLEHHDIGAEGRQEIG